MIPFKTKLRTQLKIKNTTKKEKNQASENLEYNHLAGSKP